MAPVGSRADNLGIALAQRLPYPHLIDWHVLVYVFPTMTVTIFLFLST